MRDEWYLARRGPDGNKRYGPVPLAQLRDLLDEGKVRGEDLVWREGMDGWRRADECDALFPPAPRRREYSRDERREYGPDRGPRGYWPGHDDDDRPYPRRRYPQPQSSSAWLIPVVIGGVVLLSFLSCGGFAVFSMLASRSASTSYPTYYPSTVSEPEDPPAVEPPPPWPDQAPAPDLNPPGFIPPDPPVFVPPDPPDPPNFDPNR